MVTRLTRIAVLSFALASIAHADERTFRVFGSAGNEGHWFAPDPASPLNPGNVLAMPERTNSADFTAYAEMVPESRRWKLHVKMRATDEDASRHETRGELGELYAQWSVSSWLDLTFGRAIEKWGTGYAWNPTGFVNPRKDAGDPNDRRSAYRGVDMLKADALIHGASLSAYLLDGGYAFRAYRLVHGTDISFHFAHDERTRVGVSTSRVVGNALELHGEAAWNGGTRAPGNVQRRYAEVVLGGQYTFANNINVVAEVFHGGAGLSSGEWNRYRDSVTAADAELEAGDPSSLLEANLAYAPLQMGRDYAFVRVAWPVVTQRLDLEVFTITSLRDASTLLRSTLAWRVRPRVALYLVETEFFAGRQTEFDYVQVRRLADAGVRIYF